MSECTTRVWWGWGFLPYNSIAKENITVFTDSNKNCEAMKRGNFGRSNSERCPICIEVKSNVTIINTITIK
jgi:hypothetical protein